MRGTDRQQTDIFSYISPEARVRPDHPLRVIRAMADAALAEMSPRFDVLYATTGRPSIPPEKLLRAQLIQMLYSIRSERLLMEEIDYSVLFRWFVGMNLDEPVWDATVFTKNRDRLLEGDIARAFLAEVVSQARESELTSDEHFTVDGTLVEAWASLKSYQRKDQDRTLLPADPGNPTVNFHGEKRSAFPNGRNDDQVDAMTQALNRLRTAHGGSSVPESQLTVNPFPISEAWPRAFGMAITRTTVAALWGARDAGGTIYLYAEHLFPHAEPSENARAIKALGDWIPGVINFSCVKGSQSEKDRIAQLYRELRCRK